MIVPGIFKEYSASSDKNYAYNNTLYSEMQVPSLKGILERNIHREYQEKLVDKNTTYLEKYICFINFSIIYFVELIDFLEDERPNVTDILYISLDYVHSVQF